MTRGIQSCSAEGCARPGVATIHLHPLCRDHFISVCHTQLEAYAKLQEQRHLGEVSPETVRRFIQECTRQADEMERNARDLDNPERTRLLDIIVLAAELGRHLRRGPRMVVSIPIRLSSKMSGERWEEESETRVVSRYGALMKCRHSLEIDDVVRVIRKDNGRAADARVAWCKRESEGSADVGIEFLDSEDFWGLDWDSLPPLAG